MHPYKKFILVELFVLVLTLHATGFVNSPKIITKDGNLIFESGMNRNITFRLNGKSRITINDQYDLLDLILLRKRLRNSTGGDIISGNIEWDGDESNLRKLTNDVSFLNVRVFGPQGIDTRVRELQNRSNTLTRSLRRYNARLQRIETRVQTLQARLELDSCKSDPCENGGTCFNLYNSFMCKCTKNFEGPTCDVDVNECALFAGTDLGCQNGGQCVNQYGGYSCICAPGWFGIHCTQRKGDCMQSSAWELCGHGTCVPAAGNDNFGYKCICEQGWKTNGLLPACSVDVDECTESHPPCATKCINIPGSFTCAPCPAGFDGNGVNCRDIDECATNNGGCSLAPKVPCLNTYGSYHCGECPLGWSGDGRTCIRTNNDENGNAIENCRNPSVCYPGAACTEISNTVVCTCPPGMTGSGYGPSGCTKTTIQNCGSFPCLNGGTCVDRNNGMYFCVCPRGFKPPNCTPLPSACLPNPCHNNGFCREVENSFTCQCPSGFTGRLCDGQISRCGGVLGSNNGRLKYPAGSLYEHNSQCAWLIRTNETLVLNVTFNSFELEDSTECRFDWLQINDGRTAASQVIGRFCGLNKPMGGNIISSTNYLYLWFRSDNSTAREGFDLEWNSIPPQCGGLIEIVSHGSIATPGSPGVYPKNRDCVWRLLAPNNKRIKLTFFALQIEKHDSCDFDFVQITDVISNIVLEKFCNSTRPPPLLLPTNEAAIHFHSDNEGADTGVQIYYSLEERIPGCGGTFTEKTGIIKSPILLGEPISCEYDIKMSSGESISIEFVKFNMSVDECIEIYDVNSDKKLRELQSKNCGSYNFMPSIFHSMYNAVQIKYFGRSGEFEIHYTADCFYTFDEPMGVILSPDYPNLSKAEHLCTYKIITEPRTVISLQVVDFDLKDSSLEDNDCAYSFLRINDGLDKTLLGPFCNENQPPTNYVAKSNMIILLFQSGTTSSGKGFKISYNSIEMGKSDCGGVYTKPGYTISLPTDDTGKYLHDLECYWVIMAPQGKGILINWKSFVLESTFDCTFDYIEIFDSLANEDRSTLGRYCDARPPPSFVSHSRLITIKFVSDYSDSADGFEATYDFVDIKDQCGGEIFSSTGNIYSPGYPQNYTAEVDCTWIITVPHGSQMELQVLMFELEAPVNNTNNCVADWLEIRNGASSNSSLIGRFCGKNIPSVIPSFTNQLRVTFHSDRFFNARGFKISWYVFSNGCGGVLSADKGVITSPFYPQPYPNDASCEWRIHVHAGSAIRLTIEHIDIENLYQCNYDYLEILDGHSITDRPLAKLCSMEEDKKLFETTSNEALIRFQSDSSNSQSGFLLSYTSICNRTITSMHGIIESPNYGLLYDFQDFACIWNLKAPKGNSIALEFTYFKNNRGKIYFKELLQNGTYVGAIADIESYESKTSNLQIIQNSSDVSFRLEYAMKGCLQILHRETGEFESLNYPKTYPNDLECSWTIQVPFGKGIELTIEEMDIEDSLNCTKDGLRISNDPFTDHPKERHCGRRNMFKITSSGHQLFVHFYSDSANNGKGFKASYKTIQTTCGGTLEGKNGVVSSPNYPLNYPQNVYCEWKINVENHFRIKLTLDDLDIESFYDCEMDYVSAYDLSPNEDGEEEEKKLFEKCGTLDDVDSERTWITSSNTAEIRFKTDDSNEQKGFKIHFEEICGERIYITEEDVGYLDISRHSQSNETCEWQIIAKDNTKHVILTTTHVQLTPMMAMTYKDESTCAEQAVKIYDGTDNKSPIRSKFCKTHPPAIISNGHALVVSVPLYMIAEFEAEYMTMDIACGGHYKSISGKFSSPYYPSSYPVNLECEWNIEASAGNTIVLTFESMDMEQSDDCNNDYVEIHEETSSGKLLGVYCGTAIPPVVRGLNRIWVKFRSDNDNVGAGFIASYNYVTHNELSGESGIIESPKYPSKFHAHEPYTYRITVEKNYVVLLSIKHIVDVDMPFIKFYDGYSDIGAEIDYTSSHVLRSNTNILFFKASRGPFQFEWERLSKTVANENRTAEANNKICGNKNVVLYLSKVFTSPGYPEGYRNDLDCSWHIIPADATTHAVLQFNQIELEKSTECFADYVKISSSSDLQNWKELDKLCKKENTTIKSYHGTPYLKLDFHTDISSNKTGFATYLKTACGSVLSDRKGFVNITNLAFTASTFQMECVWTIAARQGRRVRISFEDSILKNSNDTSGTCRSYFLVRNGINDDSPFLGKGKYCDNYITDILETTANHAYLKFVLVGYPLSIKASFRYEEIMHECSDNLQLDETPKGRFVAIRSPNYPNIANPHTECIWRITAPVHHIMAIHFIGKFDLTPGSGPIADACDHEFVQINDGATELMPMLGRYCGARKPDTIHTTGNVLRVKYFTDVSEPKIGFMANVTIASCGGFFYDSEGIVNIRNNMNLHGGELNEKECIYTFEAPEDSIVRFDLKFELPEADNCTTITHLELQEIDAYGEKDNVTDSMILCGSIEKGFFGETNKMLVILRIKDNFHIDEKAQIHYSMLSSRCGETISASTGILQTPGYPNGASRPVRCVWHLIVPKGKRIKIEFLDFDTGATLLANTTIGQLHSFRGRITFANDYSMQSIIARIDHNPPASVYSTDNTMTIDAFLLSIGRHRGFKLRFSSLEYSEACAPNFGLEGESTLEFGSNASADNYCSYNLLPSPIETLALTITKYEYYNSTYFGVYYCEHYSPVKFKAYGKKLLSNLFCKNSTFPLTLRFPFPTMMELIGNKHNKLKELEMSYKIFKCGGIIPTFPFFIGENTTISTPIMPVEFNGRIECAWAVWPNDQIDVQNWDGSEFNDFQLELALSTNFKGKCEEQFLLLYNGPNQDSPQLGRYCGQSAASHLIAERGLFVEYYSANYELQSTFNITSKQGSGCGGKLNYPYRNINFNTDYYKNNVECIWEIAIESGFHLNIMFTDRFFIESSEGCKKDYLKIQQRFKPNEDWQDLRTLCGREPPPAVNTTGSEVRVIFRSDSDTVGDGFSIKLERSCGGILYAKREQQQLTSAGFPAEMPNNLYCNYTILASNNIDGGISIRFDQFDIEAPSINKCLFDNVTIVEFVDGARKENVWCGVKKKFEIRSLNRIEIIVRTDQNFPSKGFSLHYSNNMCGGLITNSSIIESPHQHHDGNFPPNSKCYWNITAPMGYKILIKFEELDYESHSDCSYDSVAVYKGSVVVEQERVGKFCGHMTGRLPILNLPTNKAIILAQSDESDPSKGFKALVSILPNCDEHIYLGSSNVTYDFTNFSGKYDNNLDCSFVFKTELGRQLQIDFISFHIEEKPDCTADYLEIRDGAGTFANEIGRFCGHLIPTRLTTSRNALLMHFVSDSKETSTGFAAQITSIPLKCGNHNINLENTKKFILESPKDDNGGYPKNINCFWKITAQTNIHLKFNKFNIESKHENGTCGGDHLTIYNQDDAELVENGYGTTIVFNGESKGVDYSNFATEYVFCGNFIPDDFISNSKELYLKFKSDGNGTGNGFSIEATPAQGCYRNFTGTQGRIYIADTSDHCDIYMNAPVNYSLSMYFTMMSFSEYDCNLEYLEIFDMHTNKSLKKLCSYIDPGKSIFSNSNQLRLRIKMNTHYTQFDITYLASRDGPGCGGDFYNTAGVFTNPFYPENVRNNSDCRWNIRVPSNLKVLLRFDVFDLGAKATCLSDYLQIIEHSANSEEKVVRQFCGEDHPRIYKSNSNYVTVRFHKTVNYDGTGWVIRFDGVYSSYSVPRYYLESEWY